MIVVLSSFTVLVVAACVFLPIFAIAWIMLRSLGAAVAVGAVFALGATVGFMLAAAAGPWAVGHEMDSGLREALVIAFATAGACAGGVLATWATFRNRGMPPWRRK